jgi:tetratricopeptide (TPR) repeat protein
MEQGKIYYSEDNLTEAKAAFEMVLSIDPEHQEALQYLADIEIRRTELIATYSDEARTRTRQQDYAGAMTYWQKVLRLDPENSEARAEIAAAQKRLAPPPTQPKPKEPTQVAQKTSSQQVKELFNKGLSMFTQEKYDEALKYFKQVLALNPNHAGAKDYKGRTEARLKILKGGG